MLETPGGSDAFGLLYVTVLKSDGEGHPPHRLVSVLQKKLVFSLVTVNRSKPRHVFNALIFPVRRTKGKKVLRRLAVPYPGSRVEQQHRPRFKVSGNLHSCRQYTIPNLLETRLTSASYHNASL